MTNKNILLIPEKTDEEFEKLFYTWFARGGEIKRLGKYWIKDNALTQVPISIYGNQTFALVLAQIYGVTLLSPDDSLIARIDRQWIKRKIELIRKEETEVIPYPVFIKSVIPKLFTAGIFPTYNTFLTLTQGLSDNEELLVSEIVPDIDAEARSFVMQGEIQDIALYEGEGDLISGRALIEAFLKEHKSDLPNVVVIDIAHSKKAGWMILEFNACWGAGLNNCNPEKVINCIVAATVNNKSNTSLQPV